MSFPPYHFLADFTVDSVSPSLLLLPLSALSDPLLLVLYYVPILPFTATPTHEFAGC